jgi:hypothetical protein
MFSVEPHPQLEVLAIRMDMKLRDHGMVFNTSRPYLVVVEWWKDMHNQWFHEICMSF